MTLSALDFQQARIKQVLFKSRLRSVLYGVREADAALFSVRENPLGQWLETVIKPNLQTAPEVREMERLLSATLQTGRNLVTQYQRGQIEEARRGLEQIESQAQELDTVLSRMERTYVAA